MSPSLVDAAAILVFALVQMVPVWLNGYPFLFFDTRGYYNAGEAAVDVLLGPSPEAAPSSPAGTGATADPVEAIGAERSDLSFTRSPYYGAPLYLLVQISPFAAVFAQALAVGAMVWLTARVVLPRGAVPVYLAAALICAAATPLPWFAGYLMPDVFVALVPLGIFLLAYGWDDLAVLERLLVWALLVLSLLFHTSHIILASGLILVLAVLAIPPTLRPSLRGALAACGGLGVGIAGVLVFNAVVERKFGVTPVNPPYLTARGLEDGPVAELIRAGCPGRDFAICAADPVVNANSQVFLWQADAGFYAGGTPEIRLRLSEEDFAVFFAAAARDPGGQILASLRNTGEQLAKFGLYEFATGPLVLQTLSAPYLPPGEAEAFAGSRAAQGRLPLATASVVTYAATLAAALALAGLALGGRLGRRSGALVLLVVAAILGNALAGGALSDAHHRYQARLVWLLPLLAALLAGYALTFRGGRTS